MINMLTKLGINQKNEFKGYVPRHAKQSQQVSNRIKASKDPPFAPLRNNLHDQQDVSKLSKHIPWKSEIFHNYFQNYRLKSMFGSLHNLKFTPETSDTTIAFTLHRLDTYIKIRENCIKTTGDVTFPFKYYKQIIRKFVSEKTIVDGVFKN